MNDTHIKRVKANLNTLDYLEGTGVISTHKRKLANELFLFISCGGNGHKSLCTLRRQLEWKVDPQELADKVAFLALDAAYKELDELQEKYGFDSTEVLKIPFEGAHESINPATISPQMRAWVDPELYKVTGGMAITVPAQSGFDSTGASAWRQPGRVRLSQPNTIAALTAALTAALNRLLKGKPAGMRLNVFFLSGLAGGTSGGTIVDVPFLTRQIIRNISVDRYKNTGVSAYLMLPSACGSEPDPVRKQKGDRNAYAALKEIDYFMGLQNRGEAFRQQYGTFDVEISENIFDFCTLVEGMADGGVFFGDPADTARKVVANSILNLICTTEAKAGDEPFLVDSFLSNRTPISGVAVSKQSHRVFPRDANYCYNVIGYSSCVVPIGLMTVYVAKKVFDKVWEQFDRCGEPDGALAERFLLEAGLSPKEVKAAMRLNPLRERFTAKADEVFRVKGPYYMVNLMNEIRKVLHADGKFAGYAASKSRGLLGRNEEWARVEQLYNQLEHQVIIPMGSGLYDVYTFVIKELKRLIQRNAGLLTDTEEHQALFQRSFSWSPIDLTGGEHTTAVVMNYLDDLLPQKEVTRKAKAFVELLCSKKDEWTQLDPPDGKGQAAFDAAKIIRDFIQEEFGQVVNDTMESFLVKLYSGNKDAQIPQLSPAEDPEGHKPLELAAQTLVDKLSTQASPLLQTRTGFSLGDCGCSKYMTVPDGCKWLDKHIEKYAAAHGVVDGGDSVYRSSARDELVLYRLYVCVPAWALSWVEEAEKTYEGNPHEVGLHMEHGDNGRDWSRFPNLFNQSLFHGAVPKWDMREAALAKEAAEDLRKAADLGLVERTNPDAAGATAEYALYLPNPGTSAGDLLAAAKLDRDKSCTMEELRAILADREVPDREGFPKPAMRREELKYVNQVMTTTDSPAPADLGERLAERGLRRKMSVWDELKAAFPAAEELKALLDAHNTAAGIQEKAARRGQAFLKCLAGGLIAYDDLRACWNMELGDEKPLSGELESRLERDCKEYYAAQAFYALSDDDYERFTDALAEEKAKAEEAGLKAARARREALRDYCEKLRGLKRADRELGISYAMASRDFEDKAGEELAGRIRRFYDWMIDEL